MVKLKCYKRWPKNGLVLKQKLKKICKKIDGMLANETPVDVLMTDEGRKFYVEKFTELFLQVGYKFDTKPEFKFEWVNKLCGGGVSIYIIYKERNGGKNCFHI